MDIHIHDLGKKFQKNWVFKNLSYHFKSGKAYAITGPNGSGKSTLLQIISGFIPASQGVVSYEHSDQQNRKTVISGDQFYKYISLASPYQELVEEFTLLELVRFHFNFKKPCHNLSVDEVINKMYLPAAKNKQIKNFSSGMKQRLKLGLCFYTDDPILFLDEPTTNLDEKGINWYDEEVTKQLKNKLILVSSNIKREYKFCDDVINLMDFKILS